MQSSSTLLRRTGYGIWLFGILLLFAFHFTHLLADIPANPIWQDPSNYTDEGWYLSAPTRHLLTGHWYQPGDFNLVVDLPVWPLAIAILFHFTGPSMLAARAFTVVLIGVALLCNALLVRRHSSSWVALLVLSFAVASPFLYVYSRLGLLEPVLIFLLSVAMLLADSADPAHSACRRWTLVSALGIVALLMMLTKPTALSLFPAIAYLLWYRLRNASRTLYASLALIAAILVAGDGLYSAILLHSRYRTDYLYYFSAAALGHAWRLKAWLRNGQFTLLDLWRFEGLLASLATIVLLVSLLRRFRAIWTDSLFVASVLLVTCTAGFVFWRGYHVPHYYLFITLPLATIAALGIAGMLRQISAPYAAAAWVAVAAVLLISARDTIAIVRHPSYTFLNMAQGVKAFIAQYPSTPPLLVAESGGQITLMTGLLSICDVYGATPLREQIAQQNPGWFAAWTAIDPETLDELHTRYHLRRVATYPVTGDFARPVLLLYQLVPLSEPETGIVLKTTHFKPYRRPAALP